MIEVFSPSDERERRRAGHSLPRRSRQRAAYALRARSLAVSLLAGAALAVPMLFVPAAPASAQLFFSRRLPPAEIVSIVRGQGYVNPSFPFFRGDIYVVDANEPRGPRVRLVIDPFSGGIVERLLIRRQKVVPGPDFDNTYIRSGPPRIVNPSEEAERGDAERRRAKRIVRRPPAGEVETPVEPSRPARQIEPAPAAGKERPKTPGEKTKAAPDEPVGQEKPARSEPKPAEAAPAQQPARAAAAPAPAVVSVPQPTPAPVAPGEQGGEPPRGTKANPRRVGPVVPPPVGVE